MKFESPLSDLPLDFSPDIIETRQIQWKLDSVV